MGSLSFKASVRRLWALLRGERSCPISGGGGLERDLRPLLLFSVDRSMASTELRTFDAGAAPPAYTSLRDLIPRGAASRRSRSWDGTPSGLRLLPLQEYQSLHPHHQQQHSISWYGERPPISNNLVELAARAYLQPTVVQRQQPTQFLHRLWIKITSPSTSTSTSTSAAASPTSSGVSASPRRPVVVTQQQSVLSPSPVATASGYVGFLPSWLRLPLDFGPGLSWIFRQLRPQPPALRSN